MFSKSPGPTLCRRLTSAGSMQRPASGRSRGQRRSTCPSHRCLWRAPTWGRPHPRAMPPPNPARTRGGSRRWLGRLPSSLPRWRASGACADSDRACGRGDGRVVRHGSHPSPRHFCDSSVRVWRVMPPPPIVSLGSGLGVKVAKQAQALCEREPTLRSEVARLEGHLYGAAPTPWNGPGLLSAVASVRASRLAAGRGSRHRPAALPALNP
jgi:hypothetical protein